MLSSLVPGGVFLVNSSFGKDEVWDHLPREVRSQLIAKKTKLYAIAR
jgi:pyruvate-ferredoxin/flavodoxin oxidoreductase